MLTQRRKGRKEGKKKEAENQKKKGFVESSEIAIIGGWTGGIMKPFQYKNKIINFFAETGIASGSTKSSTTYVSSSGGGGYIKDGSGYVSAPTIHSNVIKNHEFWLIQEDGKEIPEKIGGQDIPLKDGQKVTVISGYPQGSKSGWNVLLYNYNAKSFWYVLSDEEFVDYYKLERHWGYELYIALFLLMPIAVSLNAILIGTVLHNSNLSFLTILLGLALPIIYGIVTYQNVKEKRKYVAALVKVHLEDLLQEYIAKN